VASTVCFINVAIVTGPTPAGTGVMAKAIFNEIVAYKLYNHQQTPLVVDTLVEALNNRKEARRGYSTL
jgi:hypothetical protein